MIKYFEAPKRIKLGDLHKDSNIKYVQKFTYGDFDNEVIVIVKDIVPSLKYSHIIKDENGEKLDLCLKTEFVYVSDVEKNGFENAKVEDGYDNIYAPIRKFSDIFNREIEVIGTWE